MTGNDEDVDMDDPIVTEIPVYLNHIQDPPHICGEIHVLLHSLRPTARPYGDQGQLNSVEYEEDSDSLRINYVLNSRSNTYDPSAQFTMRSHSLVSRPVPKDASSSSHCMGVLKDGILTLVPVKSLSNIRPSFDHVDQEMAQRRTAAALVPQSNSEDTPQPDAVKPLSGRALHYQQLVRSLKNSSSSWRRLDCYDYDSVEAADLFHEHILTNMDSEHPWKQSKLRELEFFPTTKDHQYLLKLASGSWGTVSDPQDESTNGSDSSFSVLNRLDFGRQIESVMQRLQIASFCDVLAILPANTRAKYSESDVLTQLEACAFCVQGNWIVLSHLSPHKPSLWDTRDAALLLLRAGREVTIQALASFNNSPKEDSEEILRNLCNIDIQTNGWRFKLKPDDQFLLDHPDTIKRQETVSASILARLKVKKETVKSGGEAVQQKISDDEFELLGRKLSEKLNDSGSMKISEIVHFIQSVSSGHYITEPLCLEILRRIKAIILRDRWAVASGRSGDLPDATVLRDVVMQMFRTRDGLSKPEILLQFEKIANRKCQLSDHDVRRVIKEFAINERGYWVFNGEPIAERRKQSNSLVKAEDLDEYLLDTK